MCDETFLLLPIFIIQMKIKVLQPPPTCASPLTSSTSAQEAQQEELRQVFDFLKSVEEKRQEERKADRRKFEEFVNSYSSSCDKREAD